MTYESKMQPENLRVVITPKRSPVLCKVVSRQAYENKIKYQIIIISLLQTTIDIGLILTLE